MLHDETGNANGGITKAGSSTHVLGMEAIKSPDICPIGRPSQQKFRDVHLLPEEVHASPASSNTDHTTIHVWNSSITNICRLMTVFFTFVMLGLNDAALGFEDYYRVNYTTVSLMFLAPFAGYPLSVISNNPIHMHIGQRGIAFIGPLAHLIVFFIFSLHPPYPVLVVTFILYGFGNGIIDAAWNAWVGNLAQANELLGFVHAFYGLGATISPTIATALITKAGWQWFEFYYIMTGGAAITLVVSVASFWGSTGAVYRAQHAILPSIGDTRRLTVMTAEAPIKSRNWQRFLPKILQPRCKAVRKKSPTAEAMSNKIAWLCALFLLVYCGIEVAVGGWTVTFMLRIRHGTPFASGLTSTGFWAGITIGRLILGFVTARLFKTERHAVAVYLIVSIFLQLLFWLIPNFVVSAVMVGLFGFFVGPMFPATIVAATKLLPKHLHVAAIGFATCLGSSGASLLPFTVGAIAQAKGVQILQPIVLASLFVLLAVWLWIPKLPKITEA